MLSVIIPTYNERDTIVSTIQDLQRVLGKRKYEIIVVDDNSPDKTWQVAAKHAKVIRRKTNKGLSPSVIEGFQAAKGDWILVMDADGQHPASRIPAMIAKQKESDVIIGSRFVPGGSVAGWSKKRLAMSRFAALLAKPVLWQRVHDPMSGFFMLRKEIIQPHLSRLRAKGYKILLEFLSVLGRVRITEVPIEFGLRKQGQSKISNKVMLEYAASLLRQALRRYKKFLKFCVVGGSGVIINSAILYSLTEFVGMYYLFSSMIAIETAIINNFLWNNFWTWKQGKKKLHHRFWKFNLTSLGGLAINMGVLFLLAESGLWYMVANLFGIVAGMLFNFFVNDTWTFKQ